MTKKPPMSSDFCLCLAAAIGASASLFVLSTSGCGSDAAVPSSPTVCQNVEGDVEVDGIRLRRPGADAAACIPTSVENSKHRLCEPTVPSLACVGESAPLSTPLRVTFQGCVEVFGIQADSDDLSIALFAETLGGTATNPGYDLDGPAGDQTDRDPRALLGRTRSVKVPVDQCPEGGAFEIADVPTETHLIARVTDQHRDRADRGFVDTYQYNITLRNAAIREAPGPDANLVVDPADFCAQHPCYVWDTVNAIQQATFFTVSMSAGAGQPEGSTDLYDGVGAGHIAGEVQDCTSSNRLMNAVVGFSRTPRRLTYFNVSMRDTLVNLDNPQPDATRSQTNADGLYAGISVETADGGTEVLATAVLTPSACGTDGVCRCAGRSSNPEYEAPDSDGSEGAPLILGKKTVRVFPDSITILTFDREVYTAP